MLCRVSATLSAEDVEAKSKSLFREYASVGDVSEAAICVRELGDTPHLHVLVRTGLSEVMDALKERDASVMSELMVKLHGQGLLSAEVIAKGLGEHTEQLEDLRWAGDHDTDGGSMSRMCCVWFVWERSCTCSWAQVAVHDCVHNLP